MQKHRVAIKHEESLYLPEWLVRMRAKDRVKYLMNLDGNMPTTSMEEVNNLERGNDPVPGVVLVPPREGEKHDYLILPSLGALSRDEVKDLVGMVKQGGYGKGPVHRSDSIDKQQWKVMVGNFVDKLVHIRQNKGKFKITT